MPIFIPLMCLLGMGVALFRGYAHDVPADPASHDDVPMRLLRWAAGLLPAQREEWGQAMLGELDHIDGLGQRWRFAAGCASAALLLPPWGRAAAAVWAVAAGSAGLYACVGVRYGLGAWGWVFAVVPLVLLASYALVSSVLLRQPCVVLPGLLGGVLVALAWLAPGYSFSDVITSVTPLWVVLVQVIAVPLLVGVAGTLWGGSSAAGRRIARLAAFSAGLYLFLYGTIAVAALGAGGPPGDPGCGGSCLIGDRLGDNTIFYLWFLPLTTAGLGWAAAAATARIRPRPAANVVPVPFTAATQVGGGSYDPTTAAELTVQYEGGAVRARSWYRTAYLVLLCAVVAVCLLLAALSASRG